MLRSGEDERLQHSFAASPLCRLARSGCFVLRLASHMFLRSRQRLILLCRCQLCANRLCRGRHGQPPERERRRALAHERSLCSGTDSALASTPADFPLHLQVRNTHYVSGDSCGRRGFAIEHLELFIQDARSGPKTSSNDPSQSASPCVTRDDAYLAFSQTFIPAAVRLHISKASPLATSKLQRRRPQP